MHLSDCENPQRVFNKYLGEYVFAPCGKCASCQRRRAARWISRLELERSQHPMTFFVTLTYDELHLPKYIPDGFGNLISKDGCILFDELDFDTSVDRGFFDGLCARGGIPYASVNDIQLFHKRLNKYFHDKVTQKYKNFRYFLVSEFGSTGYRPHYHAIYFIDDSRLFSRFSEGVFSCWSDNAGKSYGRIDVQCVEKSACSYVAAYLNKLFDLPSFYKHQSLRPFFLCSKRPSIGTFSQSSEDDKKVFESAQPTTVVYQASSIQPCTISLPKCYQNRLFPKLPFYSKISDTLRTSLYRCAYRYGEKIATFRQWLDCFISEYRSYKRIVSSNILDVVAFLSCLAEGLTSKGIERLRRLYYLSKRVCKNAYLFGVSLQSYVDRIELFYHRKEMMLLKQFYKFQHEYSLSHPVTELVHCYPEFAFNNVGYNYVSPLTDCYDFRLMCKENASFNEKNTKSHFKNDYLQKQLHNGDIDYLMIYVYLMSKKLCQKML